MRSTPARMLRQDQLVRSRPSSLARRLHGRRQGVFKSPSSAVNTGVRLRSGDNRSGVLRPVRERFCLTPSRVDPDRASVVGLFVRSRPAAIPRRIRPVIVDAVERQCVAVAVVKSPFSEGGKLFPFVGVRDASAAVSLPSRRGWAIATFLHANPDFVETCAGHPVSNEPVGGPVAAATLTKSPVKIAEQHVFSSAAITPNRRVTVLAFDECGTTNGPLSKSLTNFGKRVFPRRCHSGVTIADTYQYKIRAAA
jgi:hypothetical protein